VKNVVKILKMVSFGVQPKITKVAMTVWAKEIAIPTNINIVRGVGPRTVFASLA